jgi:hypothetical protein
MPPIIPAKPAPVIALPTTNIVDDVAVAHIKLPSVNTALAKRKMRFTEKSLYILPKTNWKAQQQSLKADEYQPTSDTV